MTTIYLSLGSNMGDRAQQLARAVELLGQTAGIRVMRVSSIYETAPVGSVAQDDFYNICVVADTTLTPQEVLAVCQSIEQELARVRRIHWGPRTIDLDILMVDDYVIDEPNLQVPHPFMLERSFVLIPLNEIAADAVHPVAKKRIDELVYDDPEVRKL
ncbi:2-amino-4-hydroxy-6-hydroxymethyldihydropteridine diphosphokinase [Macrococcus equipercicus]|uniref:2-amino-4-hydroxy-6-hydroxymethyldihydropteridine diphosphokinase n=1 Tax=Macrococcus equipercicus TaxID=69967 RepID=A0ABQ6R676_9STAP|nr:2-amino-4-hydroxy-6-hydroxymethyldihydropteridine diphosphokinase [Macrococcus equipercicus]KAA1036161.1 2-amino-4-hydroxy-6-hydroxymethyldihydropteridine diphosphokinase [Macrococcus equipercicus]